MLWRAPNNIQLTAEGMKLASVMNVTVFEDPAMKDADKFHELTHVGKATLAGAAVQAAVGFFASELSPSFAVFYGTCKLFPVPVFTAALGMAASVFVLQKQAFSGSVAFTAGPGALDDDTYRSWTARQEKEAEQLVMNFQELVDHISVYLYGIMTRFAEEVDTTYFLPCRAR